MNATIADVKRSARKLLVMITAARGSPTSAKVIKKESMSAKFITALDQLQTQWKLWRLNRLVCPRG